MTQALTSHGCFQWYISHIDRADSVECYNCQGNSNKADHTLFECPYWSGHRDKLGAHLGHRLSATDLPDILYGLEFKELLVDPEEKSVDLSNAEKVFHLFYKMAETIM